MSLYWEVHYISVEGNERYGTARTPDDWSKLELEDKLPPGSISDEIYKIISIEEHYNDNDKDIYTWDYDDGY